MIDASRFIARSTDHEAWMEARSKGVTATEVSLAATPAGFAEALANRSNPIPFEGNIYTDFGSQSEAAIMATAHHDFGIIPNDWLISAPGVPEFMATPDGLSPDYEFVAEAKTTGKDWATPPIKYRRQIQWQMAVTEASRALLLWNLRVPDLLGGFYLGWITPKTLWIERDDQMIAELTDVAGRLLEASHARSY